MEENTGRAYASATSELLLQLAPRWQNKSSIYTQRDNGRQYVGLMD